MSPSNASSVAASLRGKSARFRDAAELGAEAFAEVIRTELEERTLAGGVVRAVSHSLRKSWRIRTGMNGHHAELFSRAVHAKAIHFGSHRTVQVTRRGTTYSMSMNVRKTSYLTKALDASRELAAKRAFDVMLREIA